MRGSSAGLADTLGAGASPAHCVLLAACDILLSCLVVAPAVVTYWRSTWSLLDLYVLPDSIILSGVVCVVFGLAGDAFCCIGQHLLREQLDPGQRRLTFYVCSRVYTWTAGLGCVSTWRGIWVLLEATDSSDRTVLITTIAAAVTLAALRTLRNLCAAPFAIAIDAPADYFAVPTMFRTSSRETALYVLDCIFSVAVVGSLVVFVWRGTWSLLDTFLFTEDRAMSSWTSLVGGYTLVAITFAVQSPVRWVTSRLHGTPRLIVADFYHLVAFFATVNVWRGVWGLLDLYLMPESPRLSNWCSHSVSLVLLMLLNCSNTVLVRGVYIDAEEPAGECVVFPCHYLRIFFHKERTKKRHRRILAAAAMAAVRRSEDASVPLQMPQIDEKV